MTSKDKRPQLLKGLILLLCGIVGLAITVVVIVMAVSSFRSRWPQRVPSDVSLLPRAGSRGLERVEEGETLADKLYLPTSKQSFAIAYDGTEEIVVLFHGNGSHDGVSVSGLWSGTDAKLLVTEPYEAMFTADTHFDTWGTTLKGRSTTCTPWIKATIPIGAQDYHKTIRAIAAMDVIFPLAFVHLGESRYGNQRNHIEREIEFFVVSPEEYQVMHDLGTSKAYVTAIAIVTGCLSAVAIVLGGRRLRVRSKMEARAKTRASPD